MPFGPLIRATASFRLMPTMLFPSTSMIASPARRPAFSPGLPLMGETTVRRPVFCEISTVTPIPLNVGSKFCTKAWYSSAV